MNLTTPIASTIAFAAMTAAASASTLDFSIDTANSSVSVISAAGDIPCLFFSCGVTGDLASTFPPADFSLAAGDSETFDFITFTPQGTGLANANVSATLAFTTPDDLDTTASSAGFSLNLFGTFIGGALEWVDLPNVVTLADGSVVSVDFEDIDFGFAPFLTEYTITATVSAISIAPIPLPAGLPLLAGGIGLLALARRRTS